MTRWTFVAVFRWTPHKLLRDFGVVNEGTFVKWSEKVRMRARLFTDFSSHHFLPYSTESIIALSLEVLCTARLPRKGSCFNEVRNNAPRHRKNATGAITWRPGTWNQGTGASETECPSSHDSFVEPAQFIDCLIVHCGLPLRFSHFVQQGCRCHIFSFWWNRLAWTSCMFRAGWLVPERRTAVKKSSYVVRTIWRDDITELSTPLPIGHERDK